MCSIVLGAWEAGASVPFECSVLLLLGLPNAIASSSYQQQRVDSLNPTQGLDARTTPPSGPWLVNPCLLMAEGAWCKGALGLCRMNVEDL